MQMNLSYIYFIMERDSKQYKFDNLQPISFLEKFNKMVEHDHKNPMINLPKELKVIPLTKFPLPKFYHNMEGIFETGTRKKDIVGSTSKKKEDIQDEQFLDKHRNFMTVTIQKIINENIDHQTHLHSYKKQYLKDKAPPLSTTRTKSESKLKKTQRSMGGSEATESAREIQNTMIKKEEIESPENEDQKLSYLQKVQKQRMEIYKNPKNQKIKIKNGDDVDNFLSSKQNFMNDKKIRSSISLPKVEYNNMSAEDKKNEFIQDLLDLQKEQNHYKRKYGEQIEKQIAKFNGTVKESVEKTKKQRFW